MSPLNDRIRLGNKARNLLSVLAEQSGLELTFLLEYLVYKYAATASIELRSNVPENFNCIAEQKIGYVYCIYNRENAICKIGYSVDPDNRLKSLQTASPYKLAIGWTCEGTQALERQLHDRFKEYAKEGEWFDICVLDMLLEEQSIL